MNYRPEIDGLRAVAVVPVILFHAGLAVFSGGFVGVDVFFVISGYLITTIIINDLENHSFSIIRFYERRARRILPALFSVIFVSSIAAWLLLSPFDGTGFAWSVLGVITFTSNFVFWLDGGYFESASELKPLLHTWSLAVEEQYYLFFPILMMVAFRAFWKNIVGLLVTITVFSFLLAEWAVILNAENARITSAGFFLTPARSWELMIGSLVAFRLSQDKALISLAKRNALSLTGLGMVLWAIFAFDSQTPFPSHFALVPTLGTALIILHANTNTVTKALLGNRMLVGIGLVSYSAYLWHQPIFAFYRHYTLTLDITPFALGALLVITAALAVFTWKYIEQPFRSKTTFTPRFILHSSLLASFIAGLLAFILLAATSNVEKSLAKALSENEVVYFGNIDERQFTLSRLAYDNNDPAVLLMGSSRLMSVGSGIVGQNALNLSVSGASIEDFVAILGAATARYSAEHIYIGMDPWLFNGNSGQNRWQSIQQQYQYWAAKLDGNTLSTPLPLGNEASTLDRIRGPIQTLYQAINLFGPMANNSDPDSRLKKTNDGRIIYTADYINKPFTEIEAGFGALLTYSMSAYAPSEARRALFEKLVQSLEGSDVHLVLSPYHPDLYARMIEEKPVFIEIENEFRALAAQLGIPILGSYNPARVGCNMADFVDGMHPRENCMRKVFSSDLRPEIRLPLQDGIAD